MRTSFAAAEIRVILAKAVRSPVGLGSALASIGRKWDGLDLDVSPTRSAIKLARFEGSFWTRRWYLKHSSSFDGIRAFKIPLLKWLLATQLLVSSKKGISSHQIRRVGLGAYGWKTQRAFVSAA
jgi:hypothetical protein